MNELNGAAGKLMTGVDPGTVKTEEERQKLRERVDSLLGRAATRKHAVTEISSQPPAEARKEPALPVESRQTPLPERRALVIEGNALHRTVLVWALEKSGYEVDALDNPAEVIEAFQRCPYGIVLVDCDTPEIDGYGIASSLRMIEGTASRTPIIGLTGNAGPSERRERKAAGIDNYLLKPFRRDRVEAVVSRYAPTRSSGSTMALLALDKDRIRELQELAGGDSALLEELIDLFLTGAPELLEQMRHAAEDEDSGRLYRAAHTLKGSSGQMGALRMQELCGIIATVAGTGSLVGIAGLLSELSVAFERAVSELRQLRNSILGQAGEDRGHPASVAKKEAPKANEILMAEDDPLIARFLSNSLTAAGFHITHATNGQAALDTLETSSFAVVLLDINMPEVDGYQVLSGIRSAVGDNTPVVIISSRHQEQDVLRAFDLGADDYLTKPFNPSEVVARVRRLVRQAARS